MSNKNKDKGKAYERAVCQTFNKGTGKSFTRCVGSGAFVGGKNAVRLDYLSENQILLNRGDIVPADEYRHLVIECKAYKEFQFHNLCTGVKLLDKWINQVSHDVEYTETTEELIPLVIFKINRQGEHVVTPSGTYDYSDVPHIRYYHKDRTEWYDITTFNVEWVERFVKLD